MGKMMKIPARFPRVAAAFQESSGSEHSPDSSTDLSDLVKSFMERDYYLEGGDDDRDCDDGGGVAEKEEDGDASEWSLPEAVETLERLLGAGESGIRREIQAQAELGYCRMIGLDQKPSSPEFKRKLMTHFRESGIDSGLCKSKWEKFGRFPAREYEYVDVKVEGIRYIVEVFLVGEFDIARPTSQYASLIKSFPQIYVGKVEELKKIVRVMCTAMRESMKSKDMHIPPWRRNGYMQAKWFGSYKRTTNEVPTKRPLEPQKPLAAKKSVGFEALPVKKTYNNCKVEFGRRNNGQLKVGHLSAAFDGQGIGL